MAKFTLLEIVQTVLSDIDGDEVNSITDTVESEQVAQHVKNSYRALVSHTNWIHTRRALTLEPRSDTDFPTHMTVKEELKELISVYYNTAGLDETQRKYKKIEWRDSDEFLVKINQRNNDKDDTDIVVDDSGIELLIKNDKAPEYFTSFDDVNIIFDSYDSSVDNSLQTSKMQAQGFIIPEFLIEDSFVPDLPPDAFSLLVEDSISRAQLKMRQIQDVKSETEAQKQSRWQSRKSWTVGGGIRYPNYGRRTQRVQGIQPWDKQ